MRFSIAVLRIESGTYLGFYFRGVLFQWWLSYFRGGEGVRIFPGGVEMFPEVSGIFSGGVVIFSVVLKLSLFCGIKTIFWGGYSSRDFLRGLTLYDPGGGGGLLFPNNSLTCGGKNFLCWGSTFSRRGGVSKFKVVKMTGKTSRIRKYILFFQKLYFLLKMFLTFLMAAWDPQQNFMSTRYLFSFYLC